LAIPLNSRVAFYFSDISRSLKMNLKGIAKSYSVENVNADTVKMTLKVLLENSGKTVDVVVTGSLIELCNRFDAIPYKGSLVCHNLVNSECIIKEEPAFQLVKINRS
jgi:hypothetical protein